MYGTDFRSTPVFFIQDDHDYFDNDDAYDEIVTFPPDGFMTEMARATQSLYYPEFLPDATRPRGLAGSSSAGRGLPVSESFGTLRYGRLAEVLLYTVRRTMTHGGAERGVSRSRGGGLADAPDGGNRGHARGECAVEPAGLDRGQVGRVVSRRARRRRQAHGGRRQALLAGGLARSSTTGCWPRCRGMRGRIPLSMSGDLHAIAIGRILRSGTLDLSANPVVTALTGPGGHAAPEAGRRGIRKVGADAAASTSASTNR